MLLSAAQSLFRSELYSVYPEHEIEDLFYITIYHLLNYSKLQIHLNTGVNLSAEKEEQLKSVLDRLKRSEPVQYVMGETEFYGLKIKTDHRALIPRPETEFLTDFIVKTTSFKKRYAIADIGTGSGCMAVALAKYLENSEVTAIDISSDALELAKLNSEINQVNILLIRDDILHPKNSYNIFDIIVSNPPYVTESEKSSMHRNILDYEPHEALFVPDTDPLLFYRGIADFAGKYLSREGELYLEINEQYPRETADIFINSGFRNVQVHADIHSKSRFITALK